MSGSACLSNVPEKFDAIPHQVPFFKHYLGADGKRNIPDQYRRNTLGTHFQGIQRIGNHLIVSGGIKDSRSQLVVIHMASQDPTGPWSWPRYHPDYSYEDPDPLDQGTEVVEVDTAKWHAGGIQALGTLVAVPVYGDGNGGEIRFFDFADPAAPAEQTDLRLSKATNSKAVALTRLPNAGVMLLVWDDDRLDFHYTESLDSGFPIHCQMLTKHEVQDFDHDPSFQNINFVVDCDVTDAVYAVAMRGTTISSSQPSHASLYKFSWPDQDFGAKPVSELIQTREINGYPKVANFGAGGGVYVDRGANLFLYACDYYLEDWGDDDRLKALPQFMRDFFIRKRLKIFNFLEYSEQSSEAMPLEMQDR